MQVSITISGLTRLFGDDLAGVLDTARAADEAGIHQLVLPDHVTIGPGLDGYPFADRFPFPPEEPWLEPLTALAAIAGATERVRIGTGVLIAPLRPAVLLAKTAATLDVLSRGRLDLGVGTGWQPEEFDALGVRFVGRGARMDDTVRACRALWTQEPPVSFSSGTVSFTDVWCEPRPLQPGGVPVWFGGGPTGATARRVAELGAGWLPLGVMPDDQLAAGIGLIRAACEAAGRDPAAVGVRAGIPVVTGDRGRVDVERTFAPVPALASLGVTSVSLALGRFLRDRADVRPFLEEVGTASADR
ncbi:MAG: TIGR03619 family F420-dependent LLM class oxidoreductase [Acidimicrobiia bacterium]